MGVNLEVNFSSYNLCFIFKSPDLIEEAFLTNSFSKTYGNINETSRWLGNINAVLEVSL